MTFITKDRLKSVIEIAKTCYSYYELISRVKTMTGVKMERYTMDKYGVCPTCPICKTKPVETLVRGVNGRATLGTRHYLVSCVWVCNGCIDKVVKTSSDTIRYLSKDPEKASCTITHRQERWAMSVLKLIEEALAQNIDIRTHLSYLPPPLIGKFKALGVPAYVNPQLSEPMMWALGLASPRKFRPCKKRRTDRYLIGRKSNYFTPTLSVIRCEADRIIKDSISPDSVFADPILMAMGFGDMP